MLTEKTFPDTDNTLLSSTETDAATEGVVTARSLVALRWISITGQLAVILLGYYGLKVTLPLEACLATVAAGVGA